MIPVSVVIDGSYRKITRFLSNARAPGHASARQASRRRAACSRAERRALRVEYPRLPTARRDDHAQRVRLRRADRATDRPPPRPTVVVDAEYFGFKERLPDARPARAARERKQKIFAIVGAILLLAILAIQLPRAPRWLFLGADGGSGPERPQLAQRSP